VAQHAVRLAHQQLTTPPKDEASNMADSGAERRHWFGTWGASSQPITQGFVDVPTIEGQTIRQVVRLSIGGDSLRLKLANAHSSAPIIIGAARVAIAGPDGAILPDTDRPVCFSDATSLTLRQSESMVSDPIDLKVPDRALLAISLFLPGKPSFGAWHATGLQTAYISASGDHTGDETFDVAGTFQQRLLISGVDVSSESAEGTIVCFGDSVTDGSASTPDSDRRWPDQLARRLAERDGSLKYGVVNAGIAGNRLLRDVIGMRGLKRFERDVLPVPGVKYVTLLHGNNDLGFPYMPDDSPLAATADRSPVKAADIIAGQQSVVAMAREAGLKVYGATLPPFIGAPFFDAAKADGERLKVNEWIRDGGAFDAVIDFDAALRDPANPSVLLPAYDSGDHLHPSDTGYEKMAETIDLALFP
jgi:lysophospholipase L1-like esterase